MEKRFRKKVGILLLVIVALVGVWATTVFAEEATDVGGDSGTEEPYRTGIILSTDPAEDITYGADVSLIATFEELLVENYPTGSVNFIIYVDSEPTYETSTELTADMEGVATYVFTPLSAGEYVFSVYYKPDDNSAYGDNESDIYEFTVAEGIVKLTQTIEFVDIGEKTYGDDPFTLSIAGQEGTGAVTYEVIKGDAITIEEDVATIVGVGEVVVETTVAEDETYYEAKATLRFTIELKERVEAPVASVSTESTVYSGEKITLSTSTEGAVIYYLTNTSNLIIEESLILQHGSEYNGALSVPDSYLFYIYAIATKEGMDNSEISVFPYSIFLYNTPATEDSSGGEQTITSNEVVSSESNFVSSEGGAISLLDNTSGVALFAESGVIPADAILSVDPIVDLTEYNSLVQAQLGEGFQLISAFDINLLQDGQAIQPNGTVQLGLPIPEGYDLTNAQGVYIGDDGKIEVMESLQEGDFDSDEFWEHMKYLESVFPSYFDKLTINHFSIYGIIVPVEEEVVEAVIEEEIEEPVEEEMVELAVEEVGMSWPVRGLVISMIFVLIVGLSLGLYHVKNNKK